MIDFHCHLDLYPDPQSVVRTCVDRRLYVLSVTTTPSAWVGTAKLAAGADRIRTGLGLHPQLAYQRKGELALFDDLIGRTRYVGEIGLDGGPEYRASWSDQMLVFNTVLQTCQRAGGRILSLHSRRAATPVLDALASYPGAGSPVFHWFSGTNRELKRAIEAGCWFSVGPAMLSSEKGRLLAAQMPRERMLTETDGPFAQIDGAAAAPWDCEKAIGQLAEMWAEPEASVRGQLGRNLTALVAER